MALTFETTDPELVHEIMTQLYAENRMTVHAMIARVTSGHFERGIGRTRERFSPGDTFLMLPPDQPNHSWSPASTWT